ncbi:TPA: hypothetical protein HA239_01940 [Candidatus Woesearchaeota archaeon]|nr:hypothetical protein QT06_C0001G0990 [archaeon GW2011_AR15]MBS3104536.1 hypothetical protein [Candidatus Woesearchaeota archaeon]HIH41150.1 hypothetical protein [Candidatus Woesearchaeota archaeon]
MGKLGGLKSPIRFEDSRKHSILHLNIGSRASFQRTFFLVVLCFFVYFIFLTVLPGNERVIVCAVNDNSCTGVTGDTSTGACTAYGTCNGGPGWALGAGDCTGDASCGTTTCCGDDTEEAVITEASSTDAPAGYNNAVTACCNVATDCNYNGACVATGSASSASIPSKAYCGASSTWYGGDASSAACTAIVGSGYWNISGEVNGTVCCGDDSSQNKNTRVVDELSMDNGYADNSSDDACCLATSDCVASSTCYNDGVHSADVDGDGDNDYCDAGTWKDCVSNDDCTGGLVCSLATYNCVDPSASITIRNLGVTGVEQTNQEYTSQTAVFLHLTFDNNAIGCKYTNYPNATSLPDSGYAGWTQWESCVSDRLWDLTTGNGLKVVFYQINYSGVYSTTNDTIYYNITGAGLDTTEPTAATINDGNYTNNNQSITISWSGASDSESDLFGIPLDYHYVLYHENGTTLRDIHTVNTTVTTSGLNLAHNSTLYVNLSTINSAGLSANSTSDGLTVDLVSPTISSLYGTFKNLSTSEYQSTEGIGSSTWVYAALLNFSWLGSDVLSGVNAYSYVLTTTSNAEPDSIPEGSLSDLAGELDKTFTGLQSGSYYFKIKARDTAGNWGALSSINISIDNSPASKPDILSEQKTGDNVTYTWSAATDEESGVVNYMINLSDTNGVPQYLVLVNDTASLSYSVSGVASETYNATVGALNGAGIWRWSNQDVVILDFDPPTVSFEPTVTIVTNSPILKVWTNEPAVCDYNDPITEEIVIFSYTNTTYHESKVIGLSNGNYSFVISCTDLAGNTHNPTFGIAVNSSATPDTLSGPAGIVAYQDLIKTFNVNLTDSGSSVTGISDLKLYVNGVQTDAYIFDVGDGTFNVSFTYPDSGEYELRLANDDLEFNTTMNVTRLFLNVTYENAEITDASGKTNHIHYYGIGASRRVGLATDAEIDITEYGYPDNRLEVSDIEVGSNIFIFNTRQKSLNERERKLDDNTFLDDINPSFAYSIQDVYIINYILRYNDFAIASDIGAELETGDYNTLIRNTVSGSGERVIRFTNPGSESGRVTLVD